MDLTVEQASDLLSLKIVLEGAQFQGTVPSDLAYALWKLQWVYYRMVGQVLHESSTAVLNSEEKETYKLIFKIDQGSTDGKADISQSMLDLASKAFDKMESWEILVGLTLLLGAYLGCKWFEHLTEVKKLDLGRDKVELERIKTELEGTKTELERVKTEAEIAKKESDNQVMHKMLETFKEAFIAAKDAGREGRMAVLKGVSGITSARIGKRSYDQGQIEQIKRRATKVKATSETEHLYVTVDNLFAQDKDNPIVVVREKDTGRIFKANLALTPEDYSDFDAILDIVWNSARFPNRYFWAEISYSKRRDKVLSATISAIALAEADLPQNTDDVDEDFED